MHIGHVPWFCRLIESVVIICCLLCERRSRRRCRLFRSGCGVCALHPEPPSVFGPDPHPDPNPLLSAGLLQGLAALTNMSLQLAVIGLQPKPVAAEGGASHQRAPTAQECDVNLSPSPAPDQYPTPTRRKGRRTRSLAALGSSAQTASLGSDGKPPHSRRSGWRAEHLRDDPEIESLDADDSNGGSGGTIDGKSRLASAVVREPHREVNEDRPGVARELHENDERPGFARELASAVQKGRRLGWLTLP